jgi:hypothetical protein
MDYKISGMKWFQSIFSTNPEFHLMDWVKLRKFFVSANHMRADSVTRDFQNRMYVC